MKKEVIGKCPICEQRLKVTRLHCDSCQTTIEGRFELDKLSLLSVEQKKFVEVFVKNRGNIKEIEKDLGISYPTVRRHLDTVIEAMGYSVKAGEEEIERANERKDVLEKLSKGEITSEEALKKLKGEA